MGNEQPLCAPAGTACALLGGRVSPAALAAALCSMETERSAALRDPPEECKGVEAAVPARGVFKNLHWPRSTRGAPLGKLARESAARFLQPVARCPFHQSILKVGWSSPMGADMALTSRYSGSDGFGRDRLGGVLPGRFRGLPFPAGGRANRSSDSRPWATSSRPAGARLQAPEAPICARSRRAHCRNRPPRRRRHLLRDCCC